MDDARPSLARRALAAVILVVVAILAVRIVVGFLSAVFWIVALAVLAVAAVWAVTTLKSGARRREKRVDPVRTAEIPGASHEDRVAAELARLQQQLRDQGRL
jgi:uncharacterized protein YqfA (UPF0365 family)